MPSRFLLRRQVVAIAAAALMTLAATAPARAQSSSPMRVILPVGAGSGVDVIVRSAQPALSKALGGQPVVIENLPGAGGITGTQALIKSPPDGNTIAFVSNNHAVNPSVFRKMPYDSLNDITPITVVGGSPFVLVVNPAKVPARTARELQAFLKAGPDQYNYGSSGNGTIIHLAGEMYQREPAHILEGNVQSRICSLLVVHRIPQKSAYAPRIRAPPTSAWPGALPRCRTCCTLPGLPRSRQGGLCRRLLADPNRARAG